MSGNKIYWVIRCPKCGNWQSCWVQRPRTYTFTCRRCNHGTRLWKERTRGIGLQHKKTNDGKHAALMCQKLNEEKNL